jgi:hypothetical protein
MKRYPTFFSVTFALLGGIVVYYFYFHAENESYNKALCFDLVRILSEVNQLKAGQSSEQASVGSDEHLHKIEFIVQRWRVEKQPARREIVTLMDEAYFFIAHPGHKPDGTVVYQSTSQPLLRAVRKITNEDVLHLSSANKREISDFVDKVFGERLDKYAVHPAVLQIEREQEEILAALELKGELKGNW